MYGDPAPCLACKGQLWKELITAVTIRIHVARWLMRRKAGDDVPTSLSDEAVAAAKIEFSETAPKPFVI